MLLEQVSSPEMLNIRGLDASVYPQFFVVFCGGNGGVPENYQLVWVCEVYKSMFPCQL